MYELTKQFRFDAAHTLAREIETEGSARVHGHSYRAEVTVRGRPDPASGMIIDAALLGGKLEAVCDALDHRLLDAVEGLGPATLENLCGFVWRRLAGGLPGLHSVRVIRDSTAEHATYYGEANP